MVKRTQWNKINISAAAHKVTDTVTFKTENY